MLDTIVLLILIIVANGAPMLAAYLPGRWLDQPLDRGVTWRDGRRLLGHSDTVRGVAASLLSTAVVAVLLGEPASIGALIALFAMAGDVLSSFVKRRLGLDDGARAFGLDQIPESLLPVLVVMPYYGLAWVDLLSVVGGFLVFSLLIAPLRDRLRQPPR